LIAGLMAALWRSTLLVGSIPSACLCDRRECLILPAAASKKYYVVYQPHYWPSRVVCAGFLALLLMNLRVTRFWCRALCPLGALLGVASRWSILGLHKDAATCNKCSRCEINCQGGDDPIGGAPWHKTECHLCLNCVEACPHGSLEFRFSRKLPNDAGGCGDESEPPKALAAVVTGLAVVPLLRAQTALGKRRNERLIRPPGALNETDFLSRCIRCGECVRACPNNALHLAFTEAGLRVCGARS
jgi:ferredoxin